MRNAREVCGNLIILQAATLNRGSRLLLAALLAANFPEITAFVVWANAFVPRTPPSLSLLAPQVDNLVEQFWIWRVGHPRKASGAMPQCAVYRALV